MSDELYRMMAEGVKEEKQESPKEKQVRVARERVATAPRAPYRTPQSILSEILKCWNDDLENEVNFLQDETRSRLNKCFTSNDKNYKFFRSQFLSALDYAMRKGVIK